MSFQLDVLAAHDAVDVQRRRPPFEVVGRFRDARGDVDRRAERPARAADHITILQPQDDHFFTGQPVVDEKENEKLPGAGAAAAGGGGSPRPERATPLASSGRAAQPWKADTLDHTVSLRRALLEGYQAVHATSSMVRRTDRRVLAGRARSRHLAAGPAHQRRGIARRRREPVCRLSDPAGPDDHRYERGGARRPPAAGRAALLTAGLREKLDASDTWRTPR